jgi:monofunctional glycosyltransferase
MPLRRKLKSFWSAGPRWWVWAKRLVLVLVLWPLISTLVYGVVPVPISNLMIFRLLVGQGLHKSWMPLQAISPNLSRAVIASEDQRFCSHHGIDWVEFHDAMEGEDGPSRGASTISMQVAKNLYLWEGHSFIRKGLEMPMAIYMDGVLPKRRMMEIYLNIVEWAPGIYGAEAAAQHHFGKPAAKLTAHEAALLAASLPNPFKRDAGHPSAALRSIASDIEDQMPDMGPYLTCLD